MKRKIVSIILAAMMLAGSAYGAAGETVVETSSVLSEDSSVIEDVDSTEDSSAIEGVNAADPEREEVSAETENTDSDFDTEWFRSLSDEEARAFIDHYFDRETLYEIYGNPYEYYEVEENSDGGAPISGAFAKSASLFDMGNASDETADAAAEYSEEACIAADYPKFSTEEYNYYPENGFHNTLTDPLSTFAADVDTGSYGNLRRYIEQGYSLDEIPKGLLRYEEIINYFDYAVDETSDGAFSVTSAKGECPWNPDHELLKLTVSANEIETEEKANNFVFLMDVSGSMDYDDRIVLASKSFAHLARTLTAEDTVSIVTYSGSEDTLLDGGTGADLNEIFKAIRDAEWSSIAWGGGTNGSGGITAAYSCAEEHFIEGGNNRVIIASDGDMNLGVTSQAGLVDLIKEKKESGVFLTTLGFGEGNYSDANMEQIADAGNGNYFYIDSVDEAIRVLVRKVKKNMVTAAKDVKLQVEFNPAKAEQYKLIGYENRTMSADDFADDRKDGGETGAGSQVTVLYEIVPASADGESTGGSSLKYQTERELSDQAASEEIATLSVRYKEPDGEKSTLEEFVITAPESTEELEFTAALVEACMVINGSDEIGEVTLDDALELMSRNLPKGDSDRANCYAMLKMLQVNGK